MFTCWSVDGGVYGDPGPSFEVQAGFSLATLTYVCMYHPFVRLQPREICCAHFRTALDRTIGERGNIRR